MEKICHILKIGDGKINKRHEINVFFIEIKKKIMINRVDI